MKVCSLASSSSGNSFYLESKHSKILIDAGISFRQIKIRLKTFGVDIEDLDAAIISHEHIDHSYCVKKLNVPVYVAHKVVELWKDDVSNLHEFDSESTFQIKDLIITPFPVPHDAIDPVGFTINDNTKKVGIATDLGSVTGLVIENLKGCNMLILESNHDYESLLYSSYPWKLKQRIKSRLGHLSNEQTSQLLDAVLHDNLYYVLLAHLSKVNNTPQIARKTCFNILELNGAEHVKLDVAPRKDSGEIIVV